MDFVFPSPTFPERPSITLVLPDSFAPVLSPNALLAAADRESPEGFTANIVVVSTRAIVDVTLDEMAADVRDKAVAEYPNARVGSTEHLRISDLDALRTLMALQPQDVDFEIEQAQTVVFVPSANPEIRDLVQVHATYASATRDHYAALFDEAVRTLRIG
jgi:hypothetical protein